MPSVVHSSSGQNHQRIPPDDFNMDKMIDPEGNVGGDGFDITAGQKMVSAMSGSLLTSVLGESQSLQYLLLETKLTFHAIVTPLDVVRVRLQSQKPAATADFSKLALTTNKFTAAQSAELGVTACCREVFFAGNNAQYCLAGPRTSGMGAPGTAGADCAVEETQRKTYRSTLDGLRKIARNEGVTTLWRGLSPTLAMTIPANIIYFTGYDWLRHNPKSPFSKLSPDYAPLVGGAAARILAAVSVSPIELFRTRMQAAPRTTTTSHLVETFRGVREMVNLSGYTSLWRGLTLTLWRDVPFSGLYWWGYETIRAKLTDFREERRGRDMSRFDSREEARRRSQSRENHSETFLDSFASGATSGAFASFITTPFDVGKTRTQVYGDTPRAITSTGAMAPKTPEQHNMVRLLWHIFKTEGLPGLWRGWIPRTLKVAPACAIMISSYEVGKRSFRGVNERAAGVKRENL